MSERKLGSVTYREVEARTTSTSEGSADMPASGRSGRSVSARSSRATSTAGTSASTSGWVQRTAHRDSGHRRHVLRPLLQHRGDVPGSAAHGRRVLLRSFGDGSVGWVHHRACREHGVRDHARRRGRCDRPVDAGAHDQLLRHHRRPWWNSEPIWWLVFYALFVWVNIIGIEATMRFTVAITVLALGVLAIFYVSAIVSGEFNMDLWYNIPDGGGEALAGGGGPFLPFGVSGIFKALPFAIWFYLAIEEVPLAAEESMDPRRDVPKGTTWDAHAVDRERPHPLHQPRRRWRRVGHRRPERRCSTASRDVQRRLRRHPRPVRP